MSSYNLRSKKNIVEDSHSSSEESSSDPNEDICENMEDEDIIEEEDLQSATIENNPYLYISDYFETNDNMFLDIVCEVEEDIEPAKKRIKLIREHQTSNYVTILDIINSNVSDSEKADLTVMYDRLKTLPYYSEEFVELNTKIKNILTFYKESSIFAPRQDDLLSKIKEAEICEENKTKLISKFFSLQKCDNYEKHEIMSYINYGLKIINKRYVSPNSLTYSDETVGTFAQAIRNSLDSHIYGQVTAKEEIIDNVISRERNHEIGNITVFQGSPGVGKTYMARKIADLLGYKFFHLSIGSINNSERITGSLSVHIGAKPGEMYNAVAEMGCNNGIIFLEEFDKLFAGGSDDSRTECLRNTFLNILDPSQNCHFRDNYLFDLNIDLSKIWFIISVNDLNIINSIVRDRLRPVITFDNYAKKDKLEILKIHTIPKTLDLFGIDKNNIIIEDDVYPFFIGDDSNSGIREAKSICEVVFKRISILLVSRGKEYTPSYHIDIPMVDNKFIITKAIIMHLIPKKEEQKVFMSFYS